MVHNCAAWLYVKCTSMIHMIYYFLQCIYTSQIAHVFHGRTTRGFQGNTMKLTGSPNCYTAVQVFPTRCPCGTRWGPSNCAIDAVSIGFTQRGYMCVWVYLASWGEYLQWHGFSNLVFALMAIFIYVVVTLWSLRVLSELAIFTPRLLTLHCWGDLSVMPTALLGIGNVQQFARYSCCGAMRTDIQNL